MSVDLYVAVPAEHWPTAVAVQRCIIDHAYPVQIRRFPILNDGRLVTDGALVTVDGQDAYLEGDLAIASSMPDDVKNLNDQLRSSSYNETIKMNDVVMSVRTRSPSEMRAASYVVSALIVCFDGFGFEPQGKAQGRADFAQSLILGAEALKGL